MSGVSKSRRWGRIAGCGWGGGGGGGGGGGVSTLRIATGVTQSGFELRARGGRLFPDHYYLYFI